jgi:hypothetical protein
VDRRGPARTNMPRLRDQHPGLTLRAGARRVRNWRSTCRGTRRHSATCGRESTAASAAAPKGRCARRSDRQRPRNVPDREHRPAPARLRLGRRWQRRGAVRVMAGAEASRMFPIGNSDSSFPRLGRGRCAKRERPLESRRTSMSPRSPRGGVPLTCATVPPAHSPRERETFAPATRCTGARCSLSSPATAARAQIIAASSSVPAYQARVLRNLSVSRDG